MIGTSNMTAIDWWRTLAENERLAGMVEDKWKHDGFESIVSNVEPIEKSFRPVNRRILRTDSDSYSSVASDRRSKSPKTSKKTKKKSKKRKRTPSPSDSGSNSDEEYEWVPSMQLTEKPNSIIEDGTKAVFDVELPPVKVNDDTCGNEPEPESVTEQNDDMEQSSNCEDNNEDILITRVDGKISPSDSKSDEDNKPLSPIVDKKHDPIKPEDFAGKKIEIKPPRKPIKEVPSVFDESNDLSNSLDDSDERYSDENSNNACGWSKPHSKIYLPKSKKSKSRNKKSKKKKSKTSKHSHHRSRSRSSSENDSDSQVESVGHPSKVRKNVLERYEQKIAHTNNDLWIHDGWNELVKENPDDAKFKEKFDKKLKKKRKKEEKKARKREKKLRRKEAKRRRHSETDDHHSSSSNSNSDHHHSDRHSESRE